MPAIGETLREARMRRRVDMTEVEAATKIRAKYLRALENEEWDLLPGPTFVKTFLRTYAEYLELDPRLLTEEYRQRYERPSHADLTPFAGRLGGQRSRRRRSPGVAGPILVVALGIVVLLGALYLLGTWGSSADQRAGGTTPPPTATPGPASGSGTGRGKQRRRPAPTRVTLRLVATSDVYVCVQDASGRKVIDQATLTAGTRTRAMRSRRFAANFGNGGIRMQVNGRTYRAAASSDPLGYDIRPGRAPRRLPEARRRQLCR